MEANISILTFPQRVENNRLYFNVLVIPRNFDPRIEHPGLAFSPAWVNAQIALQASVLTNLSGYPSLDLPPDISVALPVAPVSADATDIFNTLAAQFDISSNTTAEKPEAHHRARKYLPQSYRKAFHSTTPRTENGVIDDSYACALDKTPEPDPFFQPDNDQVSWGQVFAFCLRQPALARKCGFIHEGSIDLAPGQLSNGGWLYVDFAPGADYAFADLTAVKRYAARLPKVAADVNRRLFAAVLFPVLENILSPKLDSAVYDELLLEASIYDDGFAKIVHAHQPVSDHLLKETRDPQFPVTSDSGIRLAWDDEQILTWMNRQLQEDSSKPGSGLRVDAPMGVFGYRIDVRDISVDPDNPGGWTSLCRVANKADLSLGPTLIGAQGETAELNVEVYPSIPDGRKSTGFWLPAYFAYWTGKSLSLQDDDAIDLYRKEVNEMDGGARKATKNNAYSPVGVENVPLLYGHNYQFRVRLADITGGGPEVGDARIYDSAMPEGRWRFRRHVVPQIVRIEQEIPHGDSEYFTGNQLSIKRPLLGYPSVLFTGAYPNALDLLKADFAAALGVRDIGIADPDVDRIEVEVAVRALDLDTTVPKHHPNDHFAVLYTTFRAFPADLDGSLELPLTFVDRPVIHFTKDKSLVSLGLSPDNPISIDDVPDLILPTNRDIQITVRPVCSKKDDYYADQDPLQGMTTRFLTRQAAANENGFFKATGPQTMIRGIWMRRPEEHKIKAQVRHLFLGEKAAPDQQPELIERLAKAIDVETKGLSLLGKAGQRWQFGAGRAIRHTLAPDNTSITLATQDELVNHWIVPITLLIDRDWSWDGILPTSIDIYRRKKFAADADWEPETLIGDIELKKAINIQALVHADRSQSFVCFLDAIEPKSADPAAFPDEIMVEYRIQPNFKPDQPDLVTDPPLTLNLLLPITTPPAQTPKVVGAGLAMSRYTRDADYANTAVRQRYLWVEFDTPIQNPRDAYFARITAYAPDPLLAEWSDTWMQPRPEPALPIDPEFIRIISPGHSDNQAGLNAMQQLIPATESKRHFLVPLPPGLHPESPELFGFFTYEFRVGHREGWSTAQGRFGRALSCQGVQHPLPQLMSLPNRDEKRIQVNANFAEAVFDGQRFTAQPPRTQLWALLYAQVRMADGSDNRNILLEDRRMRLLQQRIANKAGEIVYDSEKNDAPRQARTEWTNAEVGALLKQFGLPADSALSVLCVEMMPTAEHFMMHLEFAEQHISMAARIQNPEQAQAFLRQTNFGIQRTAQMAQAVPEEYLARPLSDDLGYYRMMRTSTLVAVPEVCCVDC